MNVLDSLGYYLSNDTSYDLLRHSDMMSKVASRCDRFLVIGALLGKNEENTSGGMSKESACKVSAENIENMMLLALFEDDSVKKAHPSFLPHPIFMGCSKVVFLEFCDLIDDYYKYDLLVPPVGECLSDNWRNYSISFPVIY